MPDVSTCPRCGRYVTIPEELTADEQVRCPHCEAAFPLGEAAGPPPPALIPVIAAPQTDVETARGDADDAAADLVVDEGVPALDEFGVTTEEAPLEAAAADDATTVADVCLPEDEPVDNSDTAPAMAAVYAEAFDFTPRDGDETESAAATAARLRQHDDHHDVFGELVKIVLGGIVGLAIGYYLLNFFGGPRFDRLPLYLPGCPHTYHHWPGTECEDPGSQTEPASGDSSQGER